MIVDTLSNASKYYGTHPLFKQAFDYIKNLDLNNLEDGKFEIVGRELHGFVSNKDGATKENAKAEAHKNYIDIQFCPVGQEVFGWRPLASCSQPKDEYNAEKDVTYYNDEIETFFTLTSTWFAIFYPEDVHKAQIGDGPIKKLVLKVKI